MSRAGEVVSIRQDKCLRPECQRPRKARGLCDGCYQVAQRLVQTGKTTWETLEQAGKVLARKNRAAVSAAGWLLS